MQLTPRESDVLRMLLTDKRGADCAKDLGITPGTFKVYASRIYQKHGVSSRLALLTRKSVAIPVVAG